MDDKGIIVDGGENKSGVSVFSDYLRFHTAPRQNLPSLQEIITYCQLHETTQREGYRNLAIDGGIQYLQLSNLYNLLVPGIIHELVPVFIEELGKTGIQGLFEKDSFKSLERIFSDFSSPISLNPLKEWKDHCITTAVPDKCKAKRDCLVSFQEEQKKRLEELIRDLSSELKSFLENHL